MASGPSPDWRFLATLASITLIGPLAIHAFLPAMPAIKAVFSLSETLAGTAFTVTLLVAYGSSFRTVLVRAFDAFGRGAVVCWPQQTSEQPGGQRAGKVVRFEQADLERALDRARKLRDGELGDVGAWADRARWLGHESAPPAVAATYDDLATGRFHYQRVVVEGLGRTLTPLDENRSLLRLAMGSRVIEVPAHGQERFEMRDGHAGYIAYVPVGAIKKGEALAKELHCSVCHGANLEGLGPVPTLAGRSPSYMARQLFDFQTGARHGLWSDLMKPVVAKMTNDDLVNITAYMASKTPPPAPGARQGTR